MTITLRQPSAALAAARVQQDNLQTRLSELTQAFIAAVVEGRSTGLTRRELIAFLRNELLAHTEDQAGLMRTAFRTPETELLVCAMEDEQRTIPELVDQLERASSAVEAAVAAGSLAVVCTARIEQESDYLLPALEEDGVDLTRLLADRPRIGGRQAPVARPEDDAAQGRSRSVDVRGLDYYNRRHHIFTAVDGLAPGRELQLISDRLNDVTWLRYEMEARSPRRYFWSQPQELEAGMVRTTVRCPDKITG